MMVIRCMWNIIGMMIGRGKTNYSEKPCTSAILLQERYYAQYLNKYKHQIYAEMKALF
jgi:hypothetical protein